MASGQGAGQQLKRHQSSKYRLDVAMRVRHLRLGALIVIALEFQTPKYKDFLIPAYTLCLCLSTTMHAFKLKW